MKESVLSFEEKTTQPWFTYFQMSGKYLNYFKTYPLNIYFFNFYIRLLVYRTEFSCLYLPQGNNFISTVWLWSTDECVFFWILSDSPSLRKLSNEYANGWYEKTTSVRLFLNTWYSPKKIETKLSYIMTSNNIV